MPEEMNDYSPANAYLKKNTYIHIYRHTKNSHVKKKVLGSTEAKNKQD